MSVALATPDGANMYIMIAESACAAVTTNAGDDQPPLQPINVTLHGGSYYDHTNIHVHSTRKCMLHMYHG